MQSYDKNLSCANVFKEKAIFSVKTFIKYAFIISLIIKKYEFLMARCDAIEWEDKNKGPALVREPVLGVFISEIYFDLSYI